MIGCKGMQTHNWLQNEYKHMIGCKGLIISYHFKKLKLRCHYLGAENLHVVETVDNQKLAEALNKRWESKGLERKLKVYAQVNCSGEESKYNFLVFYLYFSLPCFEKRK